MSKDKIIERKRLKEIIQKLRSEGKRIVFTNGCFDIIHIGHIRCLIEAKRQADILIVGLNTDSSVSRIKPGRPIIPEEQRAEVLSTIEMVDYITFFDEDTPYELIKEIQPDVLVKGGDWNIKDVVGADIVKEVHIVPFVEGVSTTEIIRRIQNLL